MDRVCQGRQGLKTPAWPFAGLNEVTEGKVPLLASSRLFQRGFQPRNTGDRDFQSLGDEPYVRSWVSV